MLKIQVFDINGIRITFENDGKRGRIKIKEDRKEPGLTGDTFLAQQFMPEKTKEYYTEISLPLKEFRGLMDILSKTKFMFSNENK